MALSQDFEERWTACKVASQVRLLIQRENVKKKSWRSVIRAPPNTTIPAMAPAMMPMIPRAFPSDVGGIGAELTVGSCCSVASFCVVVCGSGTTVSASSTGAVGVGVGVALGVEAAVMAADTDKAVGIGVTVGVIVFVGIGVEVGTGVRVAAGV
ncbi:MAG: hypothetical protein IIB15_02300 [Chloroflexi bacterium]|nr:hypothetical protein [Chloroflexota bacterium]